MNSPSFLASKHHSNHGLIVDFAIGLSAYLKLVVLRDEMYSLEVGD